ncbi:retrovirus-related pol polyprotein from transposon TNT 1-94 [Tanacetum coccineum]
MGSQPKMISPYDITSLDNPRLSITQVQLKGDNYDESFSIANGPRIQQLESDLASCRQKGLAICKYDLEKKLAKKQDEKVHTFLMGLDENVYGTTISNILAQDPLPNMNKNGGEKDLELKERAVVTIKVHLLDEEEVEEIVVPLELILSKHEELVPTMERVILMASHFLDLTSRTVIGAGERRDGGLFYFQEVPTTRVFKTTTTIATVPFNLWHKRLGHPSLEVLKFIPQVNLNKRDRELSQNCDVCHRAKQCREKFSISDNKAASIFELIHCDLWGPYRTVSSCAMVGRQFNKHVKIVLSDNGTEFTCMRQFFLDERIIFQTSCVGTPQQNGRVERKHRHILNVARALRFQSSIPIDFLGDKFASRSRKCGFVGYTYGQKGWRLFDLEKLEFFVSRDVDFLEHIFSYDTEPIVLSVGDIEYNETEIHEEPLSQDRGNVTKVNEDTMFHENQTMDDDTLSSPQSPNVDTEEQIQEENLGRGHRKKETSVCLPDYVTNTVKKTSPSLSPPPAQSRFSAIKDKCWRSAMDSELKVLERNQTWTIEELPSNKKALGCKWVYKIKYKSDGTIERFKARIVILGNHQVVGIDYTETFIPVAKMVTVRVFLAVVASKQWELHQMDMHNAFLHGDLEEEVFMKIPPGLNKGKPG